jgi:hypothetical protein
VTTTVPEALAALEKLGSPQAIARYFYSEGVRGTRDIGNCPVQKWLKLTTDTDVVMVTTMGVTYWSRSQSGITPPATTGMPETVSGFVRAFDAGAFPQLELPGNYRCDCKDCARYKARYYTADLGEPVKELVAA